jgi:hypothetical protein
VRSHANLWLRLTSFENLYEAFRRARRAKRARPDVAAFEIDLERNLFELQRELLGGTYRPGGYRHFVVMEPARRKISAAPFRDRVNHHALCSGQPENRPQQELARRAGACSGLLSGLSVT